MEKFAKIVLTLLATASLLFVLLTLPYYTSLMYKWASGHSMEPEQYPGDLIILTENYNISHNDTIYYQYRNKDIIHQVVEISQKDGEAYYRTKGINNSAKDYIIVRPDMVKAERMAVIPVSLDRFGIGF